MRAPIRAALWAIMLTIGAGFFGLAVAWGMRGSVPHPSPPAAERPALCWNWDAPLAGLTFRADPACSRWWGGYGRALREFRSDPNDYYHDPMWEEDTP